MTNNANITHDDGTGEAMQDGSGKTFTQEEVNNFIQSRLSRMKAQAAKENEAAFAEREKAIQEREMKLLVKEQLNARGMSAALADVITCIDEKDLEAKLNTLQKIYSSSSTEEKKGSAGFIQVGTGNDGAPGFATSRDPVRAAMGLEGV